MEALNEHGVPITVDAVLAKAGPGSVGRPHIAGVLIEEGHVASIQEAFDVWLGKGHPRTSSATASGPRTRSTSTHTSGGVCAIAHPGSLGLADDALETFVGELADAGLDGLECEYGAYLPDERAPLHEFAQRHGSRRPAGPTITVRTSRACRWAPAGRPARPDEYLVELESRRR